MIGLATWSCRAIVRVGVAMMLSAAAAGAASADETVSVGGSRVALIRPASARASVILLPGGDGAINVGEQGDIHGLLGNQLVRTRKAYAARGLAVMVADTNTDLKAAVDYMASIKRPVTVIGTSRGTLRAAEGIARGARPDALVLTSGFLSPESGSSSNVMSILGAPSALPRTLVIHHSSDACKFTLPAGVDPFIKWSGGRARVKWLSGGAEEGDPCQARGHHGFNGLDGQVVSLAAGFR
ncbi:alpha/beta hydrolase [Bradyrhizobium sp. HKCCYLS20291]|uniref:alpha/beta hydrolase n=1 Tax=Bradyrhizobium sp. HKCCYLS20291 TaxID=3420766 RepID=UPI003EC070DE